MKKLSVLLCAAFVLASCATLFSSHAPKFSFTVTDVYNDGQVEISVPDLETENSLTTGLQVVGLDIQVSNTSSKTFAIKWGDSSVDYNGKSHLIFLKGRFASDAGQEDA